jgi:hypothetical protein
MRLRISKKHESCANSIFKSVGTKLSTSESHTWGFLRVFSDCVLKWMLVVVLRNRIFWQRAWRRSQDQWTPRSRWSKNVTSGRWEVPLFLHIYAFDRPWYFAFKDVFFIITFARAVWFFMMNVEAISETFWMEQASMMLDPLLTPGRLCDAIWWHVLSPNFLDY